MMRRWVILYDDGHGRKHRVVNDTNNLATASFDYLIPAHFSDAPMVGIQAVIETIEQPAIGFWDTPPQ